MTRCGPGTTCERPNWDIQGRATDADTARRDLYCWHCRASWVDEVIDRPEPEPPVFEDGPTFTGPVNMAVSVNVPDAISMADATADTSDYTTEDAA